MGILITLISAVIFGVYPPASRAFYFEGGNSSALMLATSAIRFLFLFAYCKSKHLEFIPNQIDRWSILRAGLFQSISNIALLCSFLFLPGPVAMTILFTHTTMLLIILCLKGEKKLTATVLGSTLSSLIGISLVVGFWKSDLQVNYWGVILAFLAAIFTVIRLYMFEKEVAKNDPILVGARIFFIVLVVAILFSILKPPIFPTTIQANLWLIVSALSLSLGTFGMFWGIKLIGSFKFSLFIKVEPIFTAFFSYLLLNEVLLASQYLGMIVVILSLGAYQYLEGRKD